MDTLFFGTATREITPAYPVWMYGYADRDHRSDGVNEPLVLGCLVLPSTDVAVCNETLGFP